MSQITPGQLVLAMSIAVLAGVVKGVVGFAMPMILISGLSLFLPPGLALAGLILPTLATNGMQALRQGPRAALASVAQYRVFMIAAAIMLVLSAQLFTRLPGAAVLLAIGLPVTLFSVMQLAGLRFKLNRQIGWVEASIGAFAGFIGGLSGVWGPPMVAYLTALGTEKSAQMRAQGAAFGLGSILLFVAHIFSGVVRGPSLLFSCLLVPASVLGMWLGGLLQARFDQETFRRATLAVLLLAGLNLVRRALLG